MPAASSRVRSACASLAVSCGSGRCGRTAYAELAFELAIVWLTTAGRLSCGRRRKAALIGRRDKNPDLVERNAVSSICPDDGRHRIYRLSRCCAATYIDGAERGGGVPALQPAERMVTMKLCMSIPAFSAPVGEPRRCRPRSFATHAAAPRSGGDLSRPAGRAAVHLSPAHSPPGKRKPAERGCAQDLAMARR